MKSLYSISALLNFGYTSNMAEELNKVSFEGDTLSVGGIKNGRKKV